MLSELFENIKTYGRYVRSNGIDGLAAWKKVKDDFLSNGANLEAVQQINTILGTEWNLSVKIGSRETSDLDQIYEYVHGSGADQLNMYGDESDDQSDKDSWEKYHFYLQLVRIPKLNPLNLTRLLQIAYNLGQLSYSMETDTDFYSKKTKDFFEKNNLNDMGTYVKLTAKQENQLDNEQIKNFEDNLISHILAQMHTIQTGGAEMNPFYTENIEELTKQNNDYRKVVYTGPNQQFVLMSIQPNDDIKMEVHENHDQFVRIEQGTGKAIIGNTEYKLKEDSALIVPAGVKHQIINTNQTIPLKLYTIYSPAEHPNDLVQTTNPDKVKMKGGSFKSNELDYYKNISNNTILNNFISKYYL